MIEQLASDLRHAWRALRAAPGLSAVVVLSLGIGIGANTVVFSWIQALVFRPLPGVADASRFHLVEARSESGARPGSSWLEYRDLQEQVRAMPDLFAFRMVPFNVGEASRTERTYGLLVSGNYFSGLGLRPALGRLLEPGDAARPGGEAVAVISHGFWQARHAGSAGAIGERVRVNGQELTIVGVTPPGFQGTVLGLQFDLWVPATLAPVVLNGSRELEDRGLRGYYVMGALAPGAVLAAAQGDAARTMRELAVRYPATNAAIAAEVLPFWRASRGPQGLLLQGLGVLQGVLLVLLLAVCGNTANLLLARATGRQREMGVRLAVGAGTWRIVRLLLTEHVILGVLAAGLGTVLAVWGTQALRAMPLMTTAFPVRFQTSVNEGGLLFAVALGVLAAILFGTAPAIQLARVDPQAVLRMGAASAPRGALRHWLMAAEVGLAMIVLVTAGLFWQSLRESRDDPGFQREGVLLAAYDLGGRNVEGPAAREFAARLLTQMSGLTGVEAAAVATQVPLDIHGLPLRTFELEGRARTDGAPDRVLTNVVTPGYFRTMGIALVAGADFVDLGDTAAAPQAVINEEFVRRYLGEGAVLGRSIAIGSRPYTITGVARDSLYESFGEPPTPHVYLSYRDRPSPQGEIHLRTGRSDPTVLAADLRRAFRVLDPSLPLYNVRTLTQHVETNLALRRIPARMFGVLGPLLLALAAVGIYAVVAYSVAHRTAEIGVRLALGATAGGVVALVVRQSLAVIAIGAALGWIVVFGVYTRLLRGPLDVPAFVGIPAALMLVAAVSCWLPARRAARLDPTAALRTE